MDSFVEFDISVVSVLLDFVDARGYEIERQNYIKHLMDG